MDPVSHVNQVILLLRKQLAERAGKGAATPARAQSIAIAQAAATDQPLSELLSRRVSDLRAAGLADERSLSRVLLEEVLLSELGRHLMNEPAFQRVVDDVHASLEDDAPLREALQSLLASQE